MKARYTPSDQRGSAIKNSLVAVSFTTLIFGILPFVQIAKSLAQPNAIQAPTIATTPPPPPTPEEPPITEEEEKEEPETPEIEKPEPPLNLHDLGLILSGLEYGDGRHGTGGLESFLEKVETTIYVIAELDQTPKALQQIRPQYPYSLRQQELEGWAIIEWVVDERGNVRSVKVVSCSHSEFGEAAKTAISRSKWKAGEVGGETVSSRVRQKISFTL